MERSEDNCDEEYMRKFLEQSKENALPKIDGVDWSVCLPNHSPLINYLIHESYMTHTYIIPHTAYLEMLKSKSGLDSFTHKHIDMKEITLGVSSEEEINEFLSWAVFNNSNDQRDFPTHLISLDVEEIKIRNKDYEALIKAHKERRELPDPPKKPKELKITAPSYFAKNCHQLATKIIFGNGLTWFASIRFPWKVKTSKDGSLKYILPILDIKKSDPALSLLMSLGVYVGHGVINDRNGIQDELFNLYNIEITLPTAIEIDALTTLAGWNFPKSDLFTTNLICNGTLLNKRVSCADGKWPLELKDLPSPLLTYLIGDVRYGFITSTVFLAIIMRNLFPDPEICCNILEIDQREWTDFIVTFIVRNLSETNVNSHVKASATTRKDLFLSLREYENTSEGRQMCEDPPDRIVKFAKLIPDWSTVVHGGPRYLHIVRQFFVSQYETMKKMDTSHPKVKARFNREVDQSFLGAVYFNRNPIPYPHELPGAKEPGLICWPEFADTVFKLDPKLISNEDLFKLAEATGRHVQDGVIEAIRLDPTLLYKMTKHMNKIDLQTYEYRIWWEKTAFFDKIQIMYARATGIISFKVEQIEKITQKKQEYVFEEQMKAKSGNNREHFKDVCAVLNNRVTQEVPCKPRTSVQGDLYQANHGKNYWKNKKKRMNKKMKKDALRGVTTDQSKFKPKHDLRDYIGPRDQATSHDSRRLDYCHSGPSLEHESSSHEPAQDDQEEIEVPEIRIIRYIGSPDHEQISREVIELDVGIPDTPRSDRPPVGFSNRSKSKSKKKKKNSKSGEKISMSPKGEGYFDDTEEDDYYHYDHKQQEEDELMFRAVRESGVKFKKY